MVLTPIGVILLLAFIGFNSSLPLKEPPPPPATPSCRSNWKLCKDNAQLVNDYSKWTEVTTECQMASVQSAKYGTPAFGWIPFGKFRPGEDFPKTGSVTAIDDNVQFSNGFGAMVNSRAICRYDLNRSAVLDVVAMPRP